MAAGWKDIWENRTLDSSQGSTLARLLAADGFDTAFSRVSEDAWRRHVQATSRAVGLEPGMSVFEVGCGAGAYLFELYRAGCKVGGLDASGTLLRLAREVMPEGDWIQADAAELETGEPYDFVVSYSVFHYFPSLDYARRVVERMFRKARQAVMILDVPDLARREQAIAFRRRLLGEQTYESTYGGLEHLYFGRHWFMEVLAEEGAARAWAEDQHIEGYVNSEFRFNVFALLCSGKNNG